MLMEPSRLRSVPLSKRAAWSKAPGKAHGIDQESVSPAIPWAGLRGRPFQRARSPITGPFALTEPALAAVHRILGRCTD